jgi:Skp family chaperone for outer membrane proteins
MKERISQMTRHFVAAGFVAAVLVIGLIGGGERSDCSAKESKAARRAPGAVVVLDVTRFFKDSKQFNAEMNRMKDDVKKAEDRVKRNREKLKSQREEMEKLPAGSEERMQQEENQSKLEAALTASISFQKTTFLAREARIYLDVYKRLETEVAAYAKANGIDTVIRVADQPPNDNDPQNVLQRINRPVVWYSPATDITSIIEERLESHKPESGEDSE